jgi:hypothetical protein
MLPNLHETCHAEIHQWWIERQRANSETREASQASDSRSSVAWGLPGANDAGTYGLWEPLAFAKLALDSRVEPLGFSFGMNGPKPARSHLFG